jgi:hypothetical protein
MAGTVHIPWYATGFRGDQLEAALAEISEVALRYGAHSHHLYRYRDDRYKFLQVAEFESKTDFERYWFGDEFVQLRTMCSSWYQVPVLYGWADLTTSGTVVSEPMAHSAQGDLGPGEPGGDLAG